MATTSVLVEYSDCDTSMEQGDTGDIWEVYDTLEDEDPVFRIPKYAIPFEDSKPSNPFIFLYQFSLNLAELSPFFLDGTICTNAP